MTLERFRTATRLAAGALSLALLTTAAACSSNSEAEPNESSTTATASATTGKVAIFTPSDGLTLSSNVPLNQWNAWVPALTDQLEEHGFEKENISSTTSSSIADQSQDIQDYVVESVNAAKDEAYADAQTDSDSVTLVVAPAIDSDESSKYYGDYVSQPITSAEESDSSADSSSSGSSSQSSESSSSPSASAESTDNDSSVSQSPSSSSSASPSDEATSTFMSSVKRLISALTLAKNAGMHVVLVSNAIDGFTPDAYIQMSTAQMIGELQAQKLVDKLQLDKVSADDPKKIEVLLPYDAKETGDSADDDTEFAQEAFAGAWSVLQPYFVSGQAVSVSGTLTSSTTADDWRAVVIDASKSSTVADALKARLSDGDGDASTPVPIDGIISMNDFVASSVVDELSKLGYTGSAADINPSISISGIIDSLSGKKDVDRDAVPEPSSSASSDADDSSVEDQASQWPIVTGYGAYVSDVPNVVDGKQWMTGLENRDEIAADTAKICVALNQQIELSSLGLDGLSDVKMNESSVPTLTLPLVAVSAGNLKTALIDPGYISLADAGL